MRKGLIIMMAGLAVHQVLYSQAIGGNLQVAALAVASIGAADYAQALGRKPVWGLLAFLASPGVLILVIALKPRLDESTTAASNNTSEGIRQPADGLPKPSM